MIEDALRQIIREELAAAIANGSGNPQVMTAEQLADALQVNKATIYEWVKTGQIPFFQVGRFVRFNLREVLESQRKEKSTCNS